MATYQTPGVYIQEISTLPASISPVETAVPAFIGYTQTGGAATIADIAPLKISSMLDYVSNFGGPHVNIELLVDGTTGAYDFDVNDVDIKARSLKYKMYYSLKHFFANGGGDCYIVAVANYTSTGSFVDKDRLIAGITKLETADEPTLLLFPDLDGVAPHSPANGTDFNDHSSKYHEVLKASLAHCAKMQDRFTIMDIIPAHDTLNTDPAGEFRDNIGTQNLKYGAAYYPWLVTTYAFEFEDADVVLKTSPVVAPWDSKSLQDIRDDLASGSPTAAFVTNATEQWFNGIYDRIAVLANNVAVPAGAAIAGVYATVDRTRGVWKAPANISLNAVVKPVLAISAKDQEDLNIPNDGGGKSVNAIRKFTGKGILVWGARTLAGNDAEWRYVPVRRLFNFLEESIKKATEYVVFEPNTANTWQRVKAMIDNFLTGVWRDGGLAGATPSEAFFVNVGLGSTMSEIDVLEGRLIIEIGVAAVRPAEFIILKFTHKLQES